MNFEKLCPHCMEERKNMEDTKCSSCGYDFSSVKELQHQLRPNTILAGKYLVGDVLGEGGFGITYVGYDLNLEMKVAIKEFYPNGYATRESKTTTMLTIYTGKNKEYVEKWKDNFIKEARTLGRCTHLSGIVGVKDFFQENNTAYIVMEYLEGKTLKEYLKSNGGKLPVIPFLQALKPIMAALEELHKSGVIHRDISPDNIMLLPGGNMKLLDFGAARDYAESGERSLSVMLKPGYAPEEQYRTKGKQGPWTDVYALSGTIYKCITGITPPESMERLRNDELKRPSELGIQISPNVENALLKGMAVYAENRFQTIGELEASINSGENSAQENSKSTIHSSQNNAILQNDNNSQQKSKNITTFFSNMNLGTKIGIVAGGFVAIFLLVLIIGLMGGSDKSDELVVEEEIVEQISNKEIEDITEVSSIDTELQNTSSFTVEDALLLYKSYIDEISPKIDALSLISINNDDIPECYLYMQEGGNYVVELLSCSNGMLNHLAKINMGEEFVFLGYQKGNNQIFLEQQIGHNYYTLWELSDDSSKLNLTCSIQKNNMGIDQGKYYISDQSMISHYDISMREYNTQRLNDVPYRLADEWEAMDEINRRGLFEEIKANAADIEQAYDMYKEREIDFAQENEIHRYELIVANATWEQAYEDCLRRGGYLVRINSKDEFDYITNQIYQEGKTGKIFWLGAKLTNEEVYRNNRLYESQEFSWVDEFRKPKIQGIENISWMDYWLPGEPSYFCYDDYGNYVEEGCLCIFYGNSNNRFYFNDMNNDVLSIVNSYSGMMGYICEYE